MKRHRLLQNLRSSLLCTLWLLAIGSRRSMAEAPPEAMAAFNTYVASVESRLGEQHRSHAGFLAGEQRVRRNDPVIERLTPPHGGEMPGALLHHWRGTAFIPGAKASDFERLLRDFKHYPQQFAPEVIAADAWEMGAGVVRARLRVRQKHVLTVVMDTAYDVTFGRLDAGDGYSTSRSTRIYEMDGVGTSSERALGANEEHGFLWRLNTYWTYEERDGGLYIQIESVSLSRSIPAGLGWALRPFVESVPRESLEFTLRSACAAMRK